MGRTPGSKNKQVNDIKTSVVLESVKDLTLDKVSQKIAATQVEVQNQLAGLSTKMTEQLAVLKNVEDAIVVKRDELKSLYQIEAEVVSFDDLVTQAEQRKAEMAEEAARLVKGYEEARVQRAQDRTRDEEAYQYRVAQEHQKLQDNFAAKLAQQDKENKDRQELLVKGWNQREAELKARETEFAQLREQVANFPAVLKSEINKEVAIVTRHLTNEFNTAKTLAGKDAEIQLTSAKQEISSRDGTIKALQEQLVDVKGQLTKAHEDVKQISTKALEAASSRETVANLQKALENAQGAKNYK